MLQWPKLFFIKMDRERKGKRGEAQLVSFWSSTNCNVLRAETVRWVQSLFVRWREVPRNELYLALHCRTFLCFRELITLPSLSLKWIFHGVYSIYHCFLWSSLFACTFLQLAFVLQMKFCSNNFLIFSQMLFPDMSSLFRNQIDICCENAYCSVGK